MSINLYSLALAGNIIIYPLRVPVWILYSQPLLHVFNNLVTIPKPLPGLRKQDMGSMVVVVVGEQSVRVLWLGPVFSKACAVVRFRAEGSILWGRTLLKHFCKVLRVWTYRTELMVWPHGMFTKITTFCTPQNSSRDFPLLKEYP
jgi:hypothetical protein